MKRRNYVWTSLAIVALFPVAATLINAGDPDHYMKPYSGSPAFEQVKKLAGVWEGSTNHDKANDKGTVIYKVTSNGSAIEETLFQGTDHEMVSIYTDPKGKLTLTHYCAMGNQPVLDLQSSSKTDVVLSLAKNGGVDPKETHMHALTLTMPDKDHLVQKWISYENGKPSGETVVTLTRKS